MSQERKASKGCDNGQVATVGGKRPVSLGACGTVQNTPENCPIEGHRS